VQQQQQQWSNALDVEDQVILVEYVGSRTIQILTEMEALGINHHGESSWQGSDTKPYPRTCASILRPGHLSHSRCPHQVNHQQLAETATAKEEDIPLVVAAEDLVSY
jgi:hypothetical protein